MDWEDGIQDDDPREELLVTLPRASPETDTEEIRKITQNRYLKVHAGDVITNESP